jgi:hypothetical protein
MKLPSDKAGLYLTHNEHRGVYRTVAERIADGWLEDDDWVSPEQKAKAIEMDEVWRLAWYPSTPIGFHVLLAADLDVLLDAANKVE